jgi:hypothetical protein
MTEFALTDVNGAIRHDISESEIMSLSEARRDVLFEVLEAHDVELADEAARHEADMALRARVTDHGAAQIALGETRKSDHVTELRRVIRSRQLSMGIDNPAFESPPQDQAAIDRAELAVAEAELAMIAAREALTKADAKLRTSRANIAAALAKWQTVSPQPTYEQARDAVIAAQRQKPKRTEPIHMSALDAQMHGRGYSANVGYGRKHMRRAATRVHTGH